ncbi:MAG: SCO1664 family protein [Actinomycetota bacterium]
MTSDFPSESPAEAVATVDLDRALALLRDGELEIEGRLVDASNTTLFCAVSDGHLRTACVYKPIQGERPLWDFPDGTLAMREVAAYATSVATGWNVVPPTVLRDGPLGPGMVQLWIDIDPAVDLLELSRSTSPALRRMALLDAVINNADRKGGHLLPLPDGHVFGVDHGVCFSVEPKLRTLLWQWRGQPLHAEEIGVLAELRDGLGAEFGALLRSLLGEDEVRATLKRIRSLLKAGCFPFPSPDWPAIPWPPF